MILPWWLYLAGGALALGTAGATGWTIRDWKCEAAKAKQLEQAAKDMAAAADRMRSASAEYQQGKADADAVNYQRSEAIRTIYRDRPVRGDCAPPDAAVRVLEQAVADVNAAIGGPGAAVPPAAGDAGAVP